MTWLQAILMGILQGITEFLPISSSGHLVLFPWLMGWDLEAEQTFAFDVLVQLGTLVAVILYFRQDLLSIFASLAGSLLGKRSLSEPNARLGWMLILASLPAVIAGVLLKDLVKKAFSSPLAAAGFLVGTAILLFLGEWAARSRRASGGSPPGKSAGDVTWLDALWIGSAQILALFPGISRSGSTIAGGITRGLVRSEAARFSFLMAVPVMIGAGALAALDLFKFGISMEHLLNLGAGFLSAMMMGYAAIHWLLGYLKRRSLLPFAWYCLIVGFLAVLLILLGVGR